MDHFEIRTGQPSVAIGPDVPEVRNVTIGDLLSFAAATVPDRVALIAGVADSSARRQWTYAEFCAESQRTARALLQRFEPGERIAVWAPNIPEWVILQFGAAMAGLVLVTVNPGFRAHEAEYVLRQSRAAGIAVVREFRGNPMRATVEAVAPNCPELRDIIGFEDWESFLATGDGTDVEFPRVMPDDPVMIQYTSGTTGFPKGALLHHRGLANNAAHVFDRMGVEDGVKWVASMPLFHTAGCGIGILGALSKRATQVLVEVFEPGLVLELIETYGANALVGVPTMLIAMMEHPNFATTDLSSVRAICSGGATVPAALVTAFEEKLDATFTIIFGQTESSPVSSMTCPTDGIADKTGTIGPPMPHVEIRIVNPETGQTVEIGEVGEYCTRGYHVMRGYFEMEEATAATIDAEGWLHTGDLCRMDERGYCTVEGRLKDMIIRGGENIYPRELEEMLFRHPTVGEVAVVGIPDEKWGEEVAAFIRPAPGKMVDRDELFAYMRENLAPHKTPRYWILVESFPLTGSGKIQKYKLRELWSSGEVTPL